MQGKQELPVVLFLHGFLGSSQDFEPAIAQLSDEFCCLALDLPGHGKTTIEQPEHYTMSGTAHLIINLLDHLQIDHCAVVGYSMGGRLGLYLALKHSHKFSKAAIASASPGLKTDSDRQERTRHDSALADQLEADFDSFLSYWYRQPLFHSFRQHPTFAQMLEQRSRNQPPLLAQSLRYLSTGQQPSLWTALSQHTQPLLLLVGADDRKFRQINQEMAESCPTARLKCFPDCGHVVHLEATDAFVQSIHAFLTSE